MTCNYVHNFFRNQDRAVKPMDKLLLTLRFLATGDFYISIGDFTGVHKTTASRIIKKGITALCNMFPQIVNLPDTEENQQEAKRNFFNISRFPRVIGAIDCTHVKIVSPGGENAEIYRNRKGYFSLNCQVVGSADLKIIDLVSRWPGSTHDSHIFENSSVKMKLANGEMGNGVLLGDQGYSLKKYLLTPLGDPQNEVERMYNEAQIRTRNTIERLFGIWKRRFPILSNGIRCNINMAQMIIVACAVLHNIAIDQKEENFEENEYFHEDQEVNVHVEMNEGVDDRRPFLDYFQNLLNQRN